jgi:hypothetical protein
VAEDVTEETVDEDSDIVADAVMVETDELEVTEATEVVEDGSDEEVDETQGALTCGGGPASTPPSSRIDPGCPLSTP